MKLRRYENNEEIELMRPAALTTSLRKGGEVVDLVPQCWGYAKSCGHRWRGLSREGQEKCTM